MAEHKALLDVAESWKHKSALALAPVPAAQAPAALDLRPQTTAESASTGEGKCSVRCP